MRFAPCHSISRRSPRRSGCSRGCAASPPGQAQLTPSRPNGRHLREKMAVLATTADEALLAVPGFDAAAGAARHRRARPRATCRRRFEFESADDCAAPRIGWALRAGRPQGDGEAAIGELLACPARGDSAPPPCSASPSRKTSRSSTAPARTIPWLAVCLPSRWAPEEKIGRHFAEVHAPVADNQPAARGQRPARPPRHRQRPLGALRLDDLGRPAPAPAPGHAARSTGPKPPMPKRSPRSPACATSTRPSSRCRAPARRCSRSASPASRSTPPCARASDAARLHDALASMSASVLAYRGLTPVRDRLLEALRRRIDALPAAA